MKSLAWLGARILRKAARILESAGTIQTATIQKSMTAHDMVSHPDEGYYFEQYWHWLLPECEQHFKNRKARALDIGCGQGRLTLPLAKWLTAGEVIGIDLTPAAIEQAQHYASQRGIKNVEFHSADALGFMRNLPANTFDLVLMTEVAFVMPSYRDVIAATANLLKSRGIFFVSFRSQYFDLLHSVRARNWSSVRLVREAREGHWSDGPTWFSWHTSADIRQLLSEAGFTAIRLRGIGIASGIEGDPLSAIAQPSKLRPTDLTQLRDIETSLAEQYADCGRYILAIKR